MKHSTKRPNSTDQARFEMLKDLGCIACINEGVSPTCGYPEMHHLLSGNKRRGHDCTIPLGPWHHRGVRPAWSDSDEDAAQMYGPSLAKGSKPFHQAYGGDDELLAQVNRMIGEP